jgi:hypothetical protein
LNRGQFDRAVQREKALCVLKQCKDLSSPAKLVDAAMADNSASAVETEPGSGQALFLSDSTPWAPN